MKFAPGNKLAKGGRREFTGRKSKVVHDAKKQFIEGLLPEATKTLKACLASDDELIRFHAARWILEQHFGKAPVRVEVKQTHDFTLELLMDDSEVGQIRSETIALLEEPHASTQDAGPVEDPDGSDERPKVRR